MIRHRNTVGDVELGQLLGEPRHQLVVGCRKGGAKIVTNDGYSVDVGVHESREQDQWRELVGNVVVLEGNMLDVWNDWQRAQDGF